MSSLQTSESQNLLQFCSVAWRGQLCVVEVKVQVKEAKILTECSEFYFSSLSSVMWFGLDSIFDKMWACSSLLDSLPEPPRQPSTSRMAQP
jgi:hypothetical protein